MVYFIGNVLTSHDDAASHPERGNKSFHITPDEAHGIDATGLPVHLEHAGNVRVGEVTRSWNDSDGKKWVLANVDTSTIAGKYIRNDLGAASPVYTGLSLQHIHTEYADGSAAKRGIEVSICREPRRPGCQIVHTATNRSRYKVPQHIQRMSEVELATPAATATTVAESEPPPPMPSTTQLMAEVVEASRLNNELQKQLEAKNTELQIATQREVEAAAAATAKQTQVAQELGDAVLEHVAKLDPALANEDTTSAINLLREKYPKEIARVMEVACCASKHAKKLAEELAQSKESNDRKLMEQAYHRAVATKPGCHGAQAEPIETSVPASKRARNNPFTVQQSSVAGAPSDTLLQIQEAYNGLKGTGSTTDAMRSIAGIMGQQRERGYR